eukprot:1687453-Pleurochrysis_carterae.AAC.2
MSPRSAGCSTMYSPPEAWTARRSRQVRRTSSLARWSSVRCAVGVDGTPEGWSRVRRTGGPPSAADAEEKCRDTEKVEHGGDATTTLYLPAAQADSNDVKKSSLSTS